MGSCIPKKSSIPVFPITPRSTRESIDNLKQYFDASKAEITPKLHPFFEKALTKASRKEGEIILKFVVLEGAQAEHLATVVPFFRGLTVLRLWKTRLGIEGAKALAPALATLNNLETLALEDNLLETEGVKYISQALCKLSKLKKLVLHVNKIRSEASPALCLVCHSNPRLQEMQLNENFLGPGGFSVLIAGLLVCASTLKVLEIAHNEIGREGAEALRDALPRLVAMEKVVLSGNDVGESMEIELFRRAPKVHFYF